MFVQYNSTKKLGAQCVFYSFFPSFPGVVSFFSDIAHWIIYSISCEIDSTSCIFICLLLCCAAIHCKNMDTSVAISAIQRKVDRLGKIDIETLM